MPGRIKELHMVQTIEKLRYVFSIVPNRLGVNIILLSLASIFSAFLDLTGVASMIPLMQLLTNNSDRLPTEVQKYVVPLIGSTDRQQIILFLLAFVGALFIGKNIFALILRWWSLGMTQKLGSDMQSELFKWYANADYLHHRMRSKSTVLQAVTGAVPMVMSSILLGYVSLVVDGLTVFLISLALVIVSPVSALLILGAFGGASFLAVKILRPLALKYSLINLNLNTESWNYLNPMFEGFRESRVFGREALFADRFAQNRREMVKITRTASVVMEMPKYVFELLMVVAIFVIASFLFYTQTEARALSTLAVFAIATMRIVPTLNRVVGTYNSIQGGEPSLDLLVGQLRELQHESEEYRRTQSKEPVEDFGFGDIHVRNLSFHYPDSEKMVLDSVDLDIPQGGTVALVGGSGAGKTTFADIVSGLFVPTAGEILVNGIDVTRHSRAWMSKVSMVSQRVYVWDAPIRDLITFGQNIDEVDQDRLDYAIKAACLDELISELPDGLDSLIGEAGARLSGGQIQRIGIARALYSGADLLVFDEATSALDNQTERSITDTITALHGKVTVIVIAHRLSTVRDADKVVFFEHGKIRSEGSMNELYENDPEFRKLVELGQILTIDRGEES